MQTSEQNEPVCFSIELIKLIRIQLISSSDSINSSDFIWFVESNKFEPKMGSIKAVDKIAMFLAELLGTALLLFLGCSGCLPWGGQAPSSLQSSLCFGMVVMLIIQMFGCVSGAHLNPAVTLAAIVYDMISIQVRSRVSFN